MNEDEILDGSAEDQTENNTEASYDNVQTTVAVDYSETLEKIYHMQQVDYSMHILLLFSIWVVVGAHLMHSFWR